MATEIQKYTSDDKFANYVTLVLALNFTKNGLKDYVQSETNGVYIRLSNKCSGYLPCSINCSKTHSKSLNRWCGTCTKWRAELSRYMRYPGHIDRVNWEFFDSSDWGRDSSAETINQIVNVFVHNCRNPKEFVMDDILNIVSLFENCLHFKVGNDKQLMKKIRLTRNLHFAHTNAPMTEEKDLKKCLKILLECHQHKTFVNEKCKENADILLTFKNRDTRVRCETVTKFLSEVCDLPREGSSREIIQLRTEEYITALTNIKHATSNLNSSTKRLLYLNVIWIFMYILCMGGILISVWLASYSQTGNISTFWRSKTEDCVTMSFSFPWESDINFEYYIKSQHGHFVGRKWLIEDIGDHLMNSYNRGILFVAEMGFGKSAMISQIACDSDILSPGHKIYAKLASIHLCRYDSQLTLKPGVFVRNMAAGIARQLPEFGNIIHLNKMATEYLFSNRCIEDPQGCFDFGILGPLPKVKNNLPQLIIIVDALDECIENVDSNIFSLLYRNLRHLPPNMKFLMTSRNISRIYESLPPGIKIYTNHNLKQRNIDDLRIFIETQIKNATIHAKLAEILSDSEIDSQARKLVSLVDENFLFLIHALDYWIKVGDINQIPDSLEHIYELNLQRVFGMDKEKFNKAKSVFEILCASINDVLETDLFKFLNFTNPQKRNEMYTLLKNDLSHFLTITSGLVRFSHKTLSDYLAGEKNHGKPFYVSKFKGHDFLSRYWLNHLSHITDEVQTSDFISIFYHIANSGDTMLQTKVLEVLHNYLNSSGNSKTESLKFILHKVAARLNSYETIKLIKEWMPFVSVNERDDGNLTASYKAAAYGNEKALKALLEMGADINFSISNIPVYAHTTMLHVDIVNICKYKTHWGYSLLNIASQFGHQNVVRLLISYGIDLVHENAIGLNSFHLASEHGHIRILKILMTTNPLIWTADFNHSLFLAAKNGHLHVVEYLISKNATDHCLPCNGTLYWVPKGKERLQSKGAREFFDRDYKDYILKDDHRLLFCETALETAIQNGHLNVVKFLYKQNPNATSCADARGRTPILTAAAYDRKDILKFFLQSGENLKVKCRIKQKYNKFALGGFDKEIFNFKRCAFGLSFEHLVALYATDETFRELHESTLLNWNVDDLEGAKPVHYAACNGQNVVVLAYLVKLAPGFSATSSNGSTPEHSVTLCKNVNWYGILKSHFSKQYHIKDNRGKNVLHYFAVNYSRKSIYHDKGYIDFLIDSQSSFTELLHERDDSGRTPLHYAAMTGSHLMFHSYEFYIPSSLYHIRDSYNMSVIDILFEYMGTIDISDNHFITRIPNRYLPEEIFTSKVDDLERMRLLDSYEYFILSVLYNLSHTDCLKKEDIYIYLRNALKKNRPYLFHMLHHFFPEHYGFVMNHYMPDLLEMISVRECCPNPLFGIIFLKMLLGSTSNEDAIKQYLTKFYINKERKFWVSFLLMSRNILLYENVKTNMDSVILGGCKNVINILDYKQHFSAPEIPVSKEIAIRKMDLFEVINIAPCVTFTKQSFRRRHFLHFIDKIDGTSRFDLSEVEPYSHTYIFEDLRFTKCLTFDTVVCREHQDVRLSPSHIAAAKGFIKHLEFIGVDESETHFDLPVLDCKNKNLISPRQLAYFFGHQVSNEEIRDKMPFMNKHFTSLMFKVIMDYRSFIYPKDSAAWKCLANIHKINRRTLKKLRCLMALEKEICLLLAKIDSFDPTLIKRIFAFKNVINTDYTDYYYRKEILSHVRQMKSTRYVHNVSPYNRKFYSLLNEIHRIDCKNTEVLNISGSSICLRQFSKLNKVVMHVNMKIQACLQMLFPLSYLIYEKENSALPKLAGRDATENVKIMLFYASYPGFHNNPEFQYWDVLKSPFNNPFREMSEAISRSDLIEILHWFKLQDFYKKSELHVSDTFLNRLDVYAST